MAEEHNRPRANILDVEVIGHTKSVNVPGS